MARRLRLQYRGARYHVINRGNLQHDLFITAGARRSFIRVTGEACAKFGWRMHAYVVMRNHFHFALETPEPNLVAGMHWLQSTFSVRLLRFHRQHGHLFQGRYQSPVIEDDAHLARVCDYIHLNPVRARMVPVEQLGRFESSSLAAWLGGTAPSWLEAAVLLMATGCANRSDPWTGYADHLVAVAQGDANDERMVSGSLSRGWAIGTAAWRRALAREHAHLALSPGFAQEEVREVQAERWQRALEVALRESGRTPAELASAPKSAPWKRALARQLRDTVAPPYRWLAGKLWMGQPSSVRAYVHSEHPRRMDSD
jgi:REP element-mobilizing transposase RayT